MTTHTHTHTHTHSSYTLRSMDAVYLVASNGCRSSVREVSIVLYAKVRRKTLIIDLHALSGTSS